MRTMIQKDNKGFTLVELIVSLLVSSFVVLAASFFLSMGVRNYNTTNKEISLQMESQIALNPVENLIIEADTCVYSPSYVYKNTEDDSGTCPLLKIYSTDGGVATLYLVMLDEAKSMLILKTKTANVLDAAQPVPELFSDADINASIEAALDANRPALLASSVTEFSVSPQIMDKDTDDLVRVYIKLQYQDREYESTSNVSMRNGIHR